MSTENDTQNALTENNSASVAIPFTPSESQQLIVHSLIELQKSGDSQGEPLTDEVFARRLGIGGPTKWNLIKNGKYWAQIKNRGQEFIKLDRALSAYLSRQVTEARFEGKSFIKSEYTDSFFSTVQECIDARLSDRKRIAFYLAPTGGGKSMVGFQLWKSYRGRAIMLNAHKGWRTQGWQALRDIAQKLDLLEPRMNNYSQNDLEKLILREFQSTPRLVIIDEGEYFGKDVLDSIKRFINESRAVFAILAIKAAYNAWRDKHGMESDQIRMRTRMVVDASTLTISVVQPFLNRVKWKSQEDFDRASIDAMGKGNEIGSLDLISGTIALLTGEQVTYSKFNKTLANEVARITVK